MDTHPIIDENPDEGRDINIKGSNKTFMVSKRVTIKPNQKQRRILKIWFKWYRHTYNQAIQLIREGHKIQLGSLRKAIKERRSDRLSKYFKSIGLPIHTLDNAIRDVIKAYKSAFSNKRTGNITHFKIRPKKYTANKETLTLESGSFSKRSNAFAVKALGVMRSTKPFGKVKHDCRLTWDKRQRTFTLYIPVRYKSVNVDGRIDVCSLDPGIRTFQTLYSSEVLFKFGENISMKIKKIIKEIENKKKYEKHKWYKKYSRRLYRKIKGIVDNLHWQTANTLCYNFDNILIGSMSTNTKNIIKRGGNINPVTRQLCNLLSHYTFLQRLQSKAVEFSCNVEVINEAWTSKTCGGCSVVKHNLGSAKTFKCDKCDFQWDRDYNGARNIMLKKYSLFNPLY
jgi:transposase